MDERRLIEVLGCCTAAVEVEALGDRKTDFTSDDVEGVDSPSFLRAS